ncbi:MAG TPA: transposase, partial [Candidatus Acidoferrum sp.]|nr:transposase [Candidatus Acidoferrum sp.]
MPNIARSYARQTDRLQEIIRCAGFITGGLPASRLLKRLAIIVSDDTVLRLVKLKSFGNADECAVRCLGVDDWAWRKGQHYGTMLVDLERHCVVDLLPERSAESLAEWL